MNSRQISVTVFLYNLRLKQPANPVTPLALGSAGLGTGPEKARAAPGLAAAYPGRYTDRL